MIDGKLWATDVSGNFVGTTTKEIEILSRNGNPNSYNNSKNSVNYNNENCKIVTDAFKYGHCKDNMVPSGMTIGSSAMTKTRKVCVNKGKNEEEKNNKDYKTF